MTRSRRWSCVAPTMRRCSDVARFTGTRGDRTDRRVVVDRVFRKRSPSSHRHSAIRPSRTCSVGRSSIWLIEGDLRTIPK